MGNTSTNIAASSAGLFFVVSLVNQQADTSKDVDDFIGELLAKDQTFSHDLSEGRKWVADTFFDGQQNSLKTLRLRAGFSQAQLAAKIGMKQPNICEFEAGKRKPNIDTLMRLADTLGTTTDVVLKAINLSE